MSGRSWSWASCSSRSGCGRSVGPSGMPSGPASSSASADGRGGGRAMPAMIPDRGSSAGQRSSAAAGPTLALPDAPAIRGLGFRLFRDPADYAAIAELVATCSLHDGQDSFEDAASLQVEYEHRAGFDPHTDVILAELDGQLVGFGEAFRQVRGGRGVYQSVGAVRPDFRRRGIGRAILRHDERRLREVAKGHADPGGRSFGSWAGDWEGGARELLE